MLLTAFTGTMLGDALSHAIGNPMSMRLIAQMLVFFVFGFSPILYPASQQPDWLATISGWLPFESMATIVRAGLTTGMADDIGRSYAIVAIWGLIGTGAGGPGVGEARMKTEVRALGTRVAPVAAPSSGAGHRLRSLWLMMRFDAGRAREYPGLMVIVQVMMGAGMAITYGFLYPVVTPTGALFIVTGTPTLALIPLGFVMVPIGVSQQKVEKTFDFIWSLPSRRTAQAASTFLLWTGLAIPGMVVAVALAAWRYGVSLSVSPAIVPAVLLSAPMAISVGFGMALAIESPIVVGLITNTLVFGVPLFSPIVYPASHLPQWLMDVHRSRCG